MGRLSNLRPRVEAAPASRLAEAGTTAGFERTITGSKWRAIRREILARDCGTCQVCLAAGRFALACDVDHVRPIWEGGSETDRANLQSLCDDCHKAKTAREAARRAAT